MLFKTYDDDLLRAAIVPIREMAAYELLWLDRKISFKALSKVFSENPNSLPSDHVEKGILDQSIEEIKKLVEETSSLYPFNIVVNNTFDFPKRLRDAKEPIEIFYYAGNLNLLQKRSVAVVGSRKPSQEGRQRARKLTELLVRHNFTVVSGLAEGIDTIAHSTAMDKGGSTIGVIGTPLNKFYPASNRSLQEKIADQFLLISQIPFIRYSQQTFRGNRLFFPERNKTMSALTEATIIVEASDTSGTLIQARAALAQNRSLFILNSCFENPSIKWPHKFEQRGAIRVRTIEDIIQHLG